jgi:transposase-like protein
VKTDPDDLGHRKTGGRPTKLTAAVKKRILEATIAGATLADTATYAGISYETLRVWRNENEEFAGELGRAEGMAAVGHCLTIKRASDNGDWRAALAWLERRRPNEWSLKQIHEIGGRDGGPIQQEHGLTVNAKDCTVEELELLEKLALRQIEERELSAA